MILENSPTLTTERLILRRVTEADAPAFLALLSDREVNEFLPWFPLGTLDQSLAHIRAHYIDLYGLPSAYRYAICLRDADAPVGYVGISCDESHDLGYALMRAHWGRGIVPEAARAVLERARAAGYPFLTATHDVNNPRSGAVMRRLGMRYRYSYVERWQPKFFFVTFRMYQIDLDGAPRGDFPEYWDRYENHFVERGL